MRNKSLGWTWSLSLGSAGPTWSVGLVSQRLKCFGVRWVRNALESTPSDHGISFSAPYTLCTMNALAIPLGLTNTSASRSQPPVQPAFRNGSLPEQHCD